MPRRRNQQRRDRDYHPPYCTCANCQRRRLGQWRRTAKKPSRRTPFRRLRPSGRGNVYRYPSRGSGFWQKARWLTVRLIVLAVLGTAGLIGYHAYSGAPLGPAIVMMTEDYRVATACSTDPGTVLDFVRRPPYPNNRSNMSARFTEGWEAQVCDGDLAYELAAAPAEVTQPAQVATQKIAEAPALAAQATPTRPHKYPGGDPLNDIEIEKWVVEFTNLKRKGAGLQPLRHDDAISAIARGHSENMARLGLLSHDIGGSDPTDRAMAAGYDCRGHIGGGWYSYGLSENIYEYPRVTRWRGFGWSYRPTDYIRDAEEMARELVDGWMNSPGHRDNILNRDSRRIGVGIAIRESPEHGYSSETVYATQNFSAC